MDPKSIKNAEDGDLLKELNITPKAPGKAKIQNAEDGDLLSELGITKKKSSLPVSTDGGNDSSHVLKGSNELFEVPENKTTTTAPVTPAAPIPDFSKPSNIREIQNDLQGSPVKDAFGQTNDQARQQQQQQKIATQLQDVPNQVRKFKEKQIELAQKQQQTAKEKNLPPVPGFNATDFLKNDILTNGKISASFVLPAPDKTNAPVLPTDNSKLILTDPNRLQKFRNSRMSELDGKISSIENQIKGDNIPGTHKTGDIGDLVHLNINKGFTPELQKQLDELKVYRNNFAYATDYFASLNAANKSNGSAISAGRIKREILSDPTVKQDKRNEDYGWSIDPEHAFRNEKMGIMALNDKLESEYVEKEKDDAYWNRKYQLVNLNEGLVERHPEFSKKQYARIIGDQISSQLNGLQKTTGLWSLPNNMRIAVAELKKKGVDIPKSVLENIEADDIPTSNFLTSTFGGLYNETLKLGAGVARIGGSLLHINPDYIDRLTETGLSAGEERFRGPDADQMTGTPTTVDTKKGSPTELLDIRNPNGGKANYTFSSITNNIGKGIGQFTGFILGAKGMGSLFKVAPELSASTELTTGATEATGIDMATKAGIEKFQHEAGLTAYMIGSGYEGYYQDAKKIINGDGPGAELKRHLYALVNGYKDKLVFDVLPTGEYSKALNRSRELAQEDLAKTLNTNSFRSVEDLHSTIIHNSVKNLLMQSLGGTVKETAKIGVAGSLGTVATKLVNHVLGNNEQEIAEQDSRTLSELTQHIEHLPFTMMVPIGLAEVARIRNHSTMFKETGYDVGMHPETYISKFQGMINDGLMSVGDARKKAEMIAVMKKTVDAIPEITSEGKKLTHGQRVDYFYNRLKETAITAEQEKVKDDKLLFNIYKDQLDEHIKKREELMTGERDAEFQVVSVPVMITKKMEEDLKERGYDDESINKLTPAEAHEILSSPNTKQDGTKEQVRSESEATGPLPEDNRPEEQTSTEGGKTSVKRDKVTEENTSAGANISTGITSLFDQEHPVTKKPHRDNPALAGFETDDQKLKFIAQQSQNVSSTGEPLPVDENNDAYKSTVNTFGKDLVDAAISKYPHISNIEKDDVVDFKGEPHTVLNKIKFGNEYKIELQKKGGKPFWTNELYFSNKLKTEEPQDQSSQKPAKKTPPVKNAEDVNTDNFLPTKQREKLKLTDTTAQNSNPDIGEPSSGGNPGTSEPATNEPIKSADVSYVPLQDISTDEARFQPRGTDYSKETADKIVSSFDDNKLDPVVLYKDPKDNKNYVLAGHSRLEAHKRLHVDFIHGRPGPTEADGFQAGKIKARFFKGTEAEAMEFADRSNDLGTKNKDHESANSLRKMRDKGASNTAVLARAKTDFGKNGRYIYMLSHLNPKGKLMDAIKSFSGSEDVKAENNFKEMGQWIGSVREKLGDLVTNAHEDEMMDYLMDNSKNKKISREADFMQLINSITGTLDYNPENKLNLSRLKNETPAQVRYDNELDGLKGEISSRVEEIDNINDRLNNPKNPGFISPDDRDYDNILTVADVKKQKLNTELTALRKELQDLLLNKGKILKEGTGQIGMFETANLTPNEQDQLNEELADDDINLSNIEDYEKNISNTEELPAEGDGVPEETTAISEDVQQPADEQNGSSQQDQVNTAVQGQGGDDRGPLTKEDFQSKLTDDEIKQVNEIKELADNIGMEAYDLHNVDFIRSRAVVDSNIRNLISGKNPNGSKVNVAQTMEELKSELPVLQDAADQLFQYHNALSELDRLKLFSKHADSPEDKRYWDGEIKTLNTKPFEYWKGVYDAFIDTTRREAGDRIEEAVDNIEKFVKDNKQFTYEDGEGPIMNVTEFDRVDGVELTDENGGKINMSLSQFIDQMEPLQKPVVNDNLLPEKPKQHHIVDSILNSDDVKGAKTKEAAEREIKGIINRTLSGEPNKYLRKEIYSSLTGRSEPFLRSTVTNIFSRIKKLYDATSTAGDLEPDSSRGGAPDTVRPTLFSPERKPVTEGLDGDRDEVISTGGAITDSPGISPLDATSKGEQSDSGLSEYEQPQRPETRVAGLGDTGRSGGTDETGIQDESEGVRDVADFVTEGTDRNFEDLLKEQAKADNVPVVPMDKQNIAATLPLLKPGQLEDVYKAEQRFHDHANDESLMYGKAMLFTNGTGTGKTLLGAGIAKRFAKQGKGQITIIVPSDKKAKDWIEEAEWLQLPIKQLENTLDAPKGAVITTYANFQANQNLQNRPHDLVIYDESHKINSNQAGNTTSNETAHRTITTSPWRAREIAKKEIRYMERFAELDELEDSREQKKALSDELDKKALEVFHRTRVVFLSATPFAYHKSLTYGDGFLYSIQEKLKPDNAQNSYNNFYMQNFGYRMRYGKLTSPESGVDVDLLERQFTEGLKNKGIISSRKLTIPVDYSRQFILMDDTLGKEIDEGLEKARDWDKYKNLYDVVNKRFSYIYTNQLMEALKARWAVDRIKKHLALGRKIAVYHTYIDNTPAHPFDFSDTQLWAGVEDVKKLQEEIEQFHRENPQYQALDMRGLTSPIQTLQRHFGDKVVLFNGTITNKTKRNQAIKDFQNDNSGKDIIVVQIDAGKEGISLHDKTSKHQRVVISLGLPYKPTDAIQVEGRVYRTGQKTDAVIEYPILNLNFERSAFARKINERVRTAENLAMGEEARNMEIAFKEGYVNATDDEPGVTQGKGGKADDSRMDKTSEFDKARTYYYKRAKRTARDKKSVSGDYFATPEPLGMKMVQWLDGKANEKQLEPEAGHGAIARFMSKATNNIFIEPNTDLRTETALNANGDARGGTFEDLNIINKFDGIAMNPPFGTMSKTAMEHFQKATGHLRDRGRVVALVPVGQMDKRLEKWRESEESKGMYIRAKILLPSVTFERAATNVNTQILIVDRIDDEEVAKDLPPQRNIDLRGYDKINDLFKAIEDMDMPERVMPADYNLTQEAISNEQNDVVPSGDNAEDVVEVVKSFHAKKQTDIYVVKVNKQMSREDFDVVRGEAKKLGGYYSSFRGGGAIPGFVFDDQQSADQLAAKVNGTGAPQTASMSIADRIRTLKLGGKYGPNLYMTVLPIPQIWNGAVELVAKSVEAGTALVDAMRTGYDYIKNNYADQWKTDQYHSNMLNELRSRGTLEYDLSTDQKREADKILSRLKRGANIINEVNKVRAVFDNAKSKLTDPADVDELESSYNEFERYLFDTLAVDHIENTQKKVDLGLSKQTWFQKQKENWQNRYQRLEEVQKSIDKAGITIDEKNDMVNRADRWKSLASAKIDKLLHDIGLADTDVFIWKGRKKLDDSLFDRMAKAGVDYRKFNLYLYAKHAPERNAHNARLRRESLEAKIVGFQNELNDLNEKYNLTPSPVIKGLITKKENELKLYTEYQKAYSDPTIPRNYVKILEAKIDKRSKLMDDGGSGMTNQQAKDIIAEAEKEKNFADYEKFESDVREKVFDPILDNQKKYGLISEEDHDFIRSYYQHWVPLEVENSYFDEGNTFTDSGIPGAHIYKSKGANYITFENRVNPLTSAVIKLQATIYEGENNEFHKTIAKAITDAPDTKVWDVKAAEYAPIKNKAGKILSLREMNIPHNGIPYMDEGQKKYLLINDPSLAKALTGENVKAAIPILAKINGIFRSVYTIYNPAFTISNLFRDMETAGVVLSSTQKGAVRSNFLGNARKVLSIMRGSYLEQGDDLGTPWAEIAREYKNMGGNMTWFHQDTSDNLIKDIEKAYDHYSKAGPAQMGFSIPGAKLGMAVAEFMAKGNQAVETSTRVAMYDALVRSGVEKYKAVEFARNATINFNKKGNYSAVADSLYLFANASIQGSTNVLKTLFTTRRGLKFAGGIAMAGLTQSLLNHAFSDCTDPNHPEDCYDNVAPYEKDRYMIFKIPGGHGFIKIPLAYGFNVIYNMGENIGQIMQGKLSVAQATAFMMSSALNSFNPAGGADTPLLQQISPTATDPIVQWFTNRDGLGRKIYNDSEFNHAPDSQKGYPSDTEGAQRMARWLNTASGGNDKVKGKIDVSPGTLDWLVETTLGGMGQFMRQTWTTAAPGVDALVHWDANRLNDYNNIHPKDIPIVNRFYTAPKEKADRGEIFDIKDRSYNEILQPQELNTFNHEVDKAVRLNQIDKEKADTYKNSVSKNQFELTNQDLLHTVQKSKSQILEDEEIDNFIEQMEAKVEQGSVPEKWLKGYKATITENQNKLKKAEELKENPE